MSIVNTLKKLDDLQQHLSVVSGPTGFRVREQLKDAVYMAYPVLREEISSLRQQLAAAEQEREELQKTFDLQWNANMRGIKAWQAAHPGNDLVWPDQAKLVTWLLEQLVAAKEKIEDLFRAFHAERTGRISGRQLSNEEMQDIRDTVDSMWKQWDFDKAQQALARDSAKGETAC